MLSIAEIRREHLRYHMKKAGASNLSATLGYRQPSFLSQLAGPNPTREITEKTARSFEERLGLPSGSFDQPIDAPTQPEQVDAPSVAANTELVADVIRLVGNIVASENIELPPAKFADVVALAYVDTVEHNSTPRPEHIKQIVRLLK